MLHATRRIWGLFGHVTQVGQLQLTARTGLTAPVIPKREQEQVLHLAELMGVGA